MSEPAPRSRRLSARTFYGLIAAGVVLGVALAVGGAVLYLRGDRKPDARRIWGDVADELVVPVAVMVGGTFGGLAGVAAAVVLDRRRRSDSGLSPSPARGEGRKAKGRRP